MARRGRRARRKERAREAAEAVVTATPAAPPHAPPAAEQDQWDPAGPDFWVGKAITIAVAVFATWFAARVGFAEAARFSRLSECRSARNLLSALSGEVEANLGSIDTAREALEKPGSVPVLEIRTTTLDLARAKPFASIIDPAVFSEIERLFAFPLTDVLETLAVRPPGEHERKRFHSICRGVVERADALVRPMIAEQEEALDAAIRRLQEGS